MKRRRRQDEYALDQQYQTLLEYVKYLNLLGGLGAEKTMLEVKANELFQNGAYCIWVIGHLISLCNQAVGTYPVG